MIMVAQLSDTHFDLGARNAERAQRVMAYLADLRSRPDVIILTGDITESGKPEEYAEARMVLDADIPVAVLPGSHDQRANIRTAFLGCPQSDSDGDQPLNQRLDIGDVTIALLDSTIPGEASGQLNAETEHWLTEVLAQADPEGSVLLAMHHPPVPLHCPVIDAHGLAGPDRLAQVIRRDPRIVGVIAGHAHSAATTVFAGRPVIVAPSTASVLGGAWELQFPDRVTDHATDPAVVLHLIDCGHMTSHFRSVPMGGWLAE